jgi:hypothetical protein
VEAQDRVAQEIAHSVLTALDGHSPPGRVV